jgi:hypothetical protein
MEVPSRRRHLTQQANLRSISPFALVALLVGPVWGPTIEIRHEGDQGEEQEDQSEHPAQFDGRGFRGTWIGVFEAFIKRQGPSERHGAGVYTTDSLTGAIFADRGRGRDRRSDEQFGRDNHGGDETHGLNAR